MELPLPQWNYFRFVHPPNLFELLLKLHHIWHILTSWQRQTSNGTKLQIIYALHVFFIIDFYYNISPTSLEADIDLRGTRASSSSLWSSIATLLLVFFPIRASLKLFLPQPFSTEAKLERKLAMLLLVAFSNSPSPYIPSTISFNYNASLTVRSSILFPSSPMASSLADSATRPTFCWFWFSVAILVLVLFYHPSLIAGLKIRYVEMCFLSESASDQFRYLGFVSLNLFSSVYCDA